MREKDLVLLTDLITHLKMGKEVQLCEFEADSLDEDLNSLFYRMVKAARIKHCSGQTIDTLISERGSSIAKYLKNERRDWNPRIPIS